MSPPTSLGLSRLPVSLLNNAICEPSTKDQPSGTLMVATVPSLPSAGPVMSRKLSKPGSSAGGAASSTKAKNELDMVPSSIGRSSAAREPSYWVTDEVGNEQ